MEEEFVKIAILESAIEAQLLSSILDEEEIVYIIRSYHDTAYDGLFQVQLGWGEIRAPISKKMKLMKLSTICERKPTIPEQRTMPTNRLFNWPVIMELFDPVTQSVTSTYGKMQYHKYTANSIMLYPIERC